jgi:hypothetical protein
LRQLVSKPSAARQLAPKTTGLHAAETWRSCRHRISEPITRGDASALRRNPARDAAIGAGRARRFPPTPHPPTTGTLARTLSLIGDTLVKLDAQGRPQPALAVAWQSDPSARHWQFTLRRGVKFHDGSAASPAAVAQILGALHPGWNVRASADAISIERKRQCHRLLAELALPRNLLLKRNANGIPIGTGHSSSPTGSPETAQARRERRELGGTSFCGCGRNRIWQIAARPGHRARTGQDRPDRSRAAGSHGSPQGTSRRHRCRCLWNCWRWFSPRTQRRKTLASEKRWRSPSIASRFSPCC